MIVIFVHGMCATGESWNGVDADLADAFPTPQNGGPTFVPPSTLPGIDSNDKIGLKEMATFYVFNNSQTSMQDWVEHILGFFPPGTDRDVCLIGHSQGGAVISHVADARPDRIARLIYIAAMLPAQNQTAKQISEQAREMANPELSARDFAILLATGGLVRQPKPPTEAPLALVPSARDLDRCFLLAEDDGVLPRALQEKMIEAYRDAGMAIKVATLPPGPLPKGHLPQYQNKAALVAQLKDWIEEIL